MVTERCAHDSHRAIARPRDGRCRIARGGGSTRSTTWNRARRRRFRRIAPAPRSTARSRHWREFSCLTQAQTRLPHFGGFAAIIGAMSAASLAEPSWRVKHFAHEDKGLRPGWGPMRRYPVWYDAPARPDPAFQIPPPTAPRPTDMARIYLIAGSAEIARRRRLVPPGHLVEAWQDLRIPDRFWVGDEANSLLDATGGPPPPELS